MQDIRILGIDEAGRGPVLGPLVLCGAVLSQSKINDLVDLNPIDSKKLTHKQRLSYEKGLKNILDDYKILVVEPFEIDTYVKRNKLNILEAEKMAKIINHFKPEIVYLDAPQISTIKFRKIVENNLKCNPKIIAENYAERYPIVAAASILAKIQRDQIIKSMESKYGKIGSGYSFDVDTIQFLRNYVLENRELPKIARTTWAPAKRILRSVLYKQEELI
jgi:ribonuclease HII